MADMETNLYPIFTFLEANKREYREDQTPSYPRRTDNDMHDDCRKDDRSETNTCRHCVEVIV